MGKENWQGLDGEQVLRTLPYCRQRMDLHLHTCFSDGTDTLPQLIEQLKKQEIAVFAVTDHDTIEGALRMRELVPQEFVYIPGVELSCISPAGKCHILGYYYEAENKELCQLLEEGKGLRLIKLQNRLAYLKQEHGIALPEEALQRLSSLQIVGKPHLAQELIKMGLAETVTEAIKKYLNGCKVRGNDRLDAQKAIQTLHSASACSVWAHPLGGEGEHRLTREQFQKQLSILLTYGLKGLECWYSRYEEEEIRFLLKTARKYDLVITGGSDYHGYNKNISLGECNAFGKKVYGLDFR